MTSIIFQWLNYEVFLNIAFIQLRNERRSKSVSLDALAAKEVNDILPSEDKHSGTQSARKEVVEATGATLKLPGTSTQRPAMFSAFDLKVSAS